MERQIRFCTTAEGARIAYAIFGEGSALVWPAPWVSHLEEEWNHPIIQHFFKRLAVCHTILKYDRHGCGLSDRDRKEFTLEKEVRDLEAVIEHADLRKFSLFGMSQGGPTAIAYAVNHPDRVDRLILYGTFARGNAGASPEVKASLARLIRTSWGIGSKTLADIFIPDSGLEGLKFMKNYQRMAATSEMAAQLLEVEERIDVTNLLPQVAVPTLILHRKKDLAVSVKAGRELAASIPNASLVLLDGVDHIPWLGDSESILRAVASFLDDELSDCSMDRNESSGEMPSYNRRLAAIMSADVKGYSRLMSDDETQTIITLTAYRKVMIDLIQTHKGRVVDCVGDSLLAAFNSVIEAVQCSVQIQNDLESKNEQLPESRRMRFRIGVNLGDVIEEDERIYGDGVNIAARIQGLAQGGGICVSGAVYDLIESKMNLDSRFLGEQTVKNIPKPVPVYQIDIEGHDRLKRRD